MIYIYLQIDVGIIWIYIKAGGLVLFYLLVFFHIVFTAAQVVTNLWLSVWSNAHAPVNGTLNTIGYLEIYAALCGAQGKSVFIVS